MIMFSTLIMWVVTCYENRTLLNPIPYLFIDVHVDLKIRIKQYDNLLYKFQNERKIWPQIVVTLKPSKPWPCRETCSVDNSDVGGT